MGSSKKEWDENRKYEASQAAATRILTKLGVAIERLDRLAEQGDAQMRYPTELKIKMLYDDRGDVLAILKVNGPEGRQVAFQGADTVSDALRGMMNRWENGTLSWREDKPYGE